MNEVITISSVNWLGLPRGYLNPGEMEVIVALVASVSPKAVLELGCNTGRTAKVLLTNIPEIEHYQGVDVPKTYRPFLESQLSEIPAVPGQFVLRDSQFELIIRPRGSLDLTAADLRLCDACFIDGDHSEIVVLHDSYLAEQVVRPGGVIIWHDFHNGGTPGVKVVIDRLVSEGWSVRTVDNTWLAYSRR